jgi:hypothetical protein
MEPLRVFENLLSLQQDGPVDHSAVDDGHTAF